MNSSKETPHKTSYLAVIKRTAALIFLFLLGIAGAFLSEGPLRKFIQHLYRLSTNDAIYFVGKNFHLFASNFYYLSFGLFTCLFWLVMKKQKAKKIFLISILTISIFIINIIVNCFFDSNVKLVECTGCNDGTRGLNYNEINYEWIVLSGLYLSMIPCVINLWKRLKFPRSRIHLHK